jgi:D-glycero-D-manno-heptose 1,7-bisphosphate phosphatase
MTDPAPSRRAVFLDRDDTLIRNIPYLGDPAQVEILPGVPEALRALKAAGFQLLVVSNQSGVGRGLITPHQVNAVNAAMERLLGPSLIDGYYLSFADPSTPQGRAERKPSPFLLHRAREERGIDLAASFMVGDKKIDIECGRNAGCRASILVLTGTEPREVEGASALATHTAPDLLHATHWILHHT